MEKNLNRRHFFHEFPSERWFKSGTQSLLTRTDARDRADIIYHTIHIATLRLMQNNLCHKSGRTQNI